MSMKIAAVQMVSGPRPDENLDRAEARVAEAAAQGAELVALPEYFCLMGLRDRDKLAIAEPDGDGPIQRRLAQIAARHRVWLVAGSLPLAVPGDADHATNTTLVFDPEGRRAGRYDKIHLFRFDDGERRHDEAATLRAGHAPLALDITARDGRTHRTGITIVRIHHPLLDTPSPAHPGKFNLPGHHAQKVRKVSAAAALSHSAAATAPGRRPARRAAPAPSSRAGRGPGGGSSPSPRSPGRRTAARAWSASGR